MTCVEEEPAGVKIFAADCVKPEEELGGYVPATVAARCLGVSRPYIWRLIFNSALVGRKFGYMLVIELDSLERLFAARAAKKVGSGD